MYLIIAEYISEQLRCGFFIGYANEVSGNLLEDIRHWPPGSPFDYAAFPEYFRDEGFPIYPITGDDYLWTDYCSSCGITSVMAIKTEKKINKKWFVAERSQRSYIDLDIDIENELLNSIFREYPSIN